VSSPTDIDHHECAEALMTELKGRITVAGTNIGIPNLVVSLVPTSIGKAVTASRLAERRSAATISDQDGNFLFELPGQPAGVAPASARMCVCVATPETSSGEASILHRTAAFLPGNGPHAFLIALPPSDLGKKGVPLPESVGLPTMAKDLAANANELESLATAERAARQGIAKKRLAERVALQADFQSEVAAHIRSALAGLPDGAPAPRNFVSPVESVRQKCLDLTRIGLTETVNTPAARERAAGIVLLDQHHLGKLAAYATADGGFANVPAAHVVDGAGFTFEELVRGARAGEPAARQRVAPIDKTCMSVRSKEAGAAHALGVDVGAAAPTAGGSTPGSAPSTNGNGSGPHTLSADKELPTGLVDVLSTLVAPDWIPSMATVSGEGSSSHQAGGSFTLVPGPADQAAFYDFNRLDIAFEPVWQAAIDEGLIDALQDAYGIYVERTGTKPPPPKVKAGGVGTTTVRSHISSLKNGTTVVTAPVPLEVFEVFELTLDQWAELNPAIQHRLKTLAIKALAPGASVRVGGVYTENLRAAHDRVAAREQGERLIRNAVGSQAASFSSLVRHLEQRAKAAYPFTVFAANGAERSVNFGLITTYRQHWVPVAYQVGRLVRSEPLAPKEVRRFTRKTVVRKSRAEKEVANNLRARKEEMDSTSRSESDIVRRALGKTTFSLSADGSYDIGISSGSAKTAFEKSAEVASEETKKDFHEAVVKAAQEYRDERNIEVNISTSTDTEIESSGEISNPNDEITVTYLFYELQRRMQVTERLHRVTPVVLVAREVPTPGEVDDDWLVAYDWILRRVLLDDSFVPALAYLSSRLPGDELALTEMRKTLAQQRELTEQLQSEVVALQDRATRRYASLERSIEKRAAAIGDESTDGWYTDAFEFFAGSSSSPEAAQVREEAARDAYEKAAQDEKNLRMRVEREVTALAAATEAYSKSLAEHTNRQAQVARLKQHVTQNILYYMQAIWSYEPTDQQYFRLHRVAVPVLRAKSQTFTLKRATAPIGVGLPGLRAPHVFEVICNSTLEVTSGQSTETVELATVADLDRPLGYKGNYMIFPLKSSNALTDFMMTPYVDAELGLRDPDDPSNWTLAEFAEYVLCLQRHRPAEFASAKAELAAIYRTLLTKPLRNGEEIIVPTDSLFIEALPGSHSVLEEFKLRHRAMDVMKVRAEVRGAEIENVRMAARLLAAEYDDPTIDRRITIDGTAANVLVPADS
jgi:hypothetical protein